MNIWVYIIRRTLYVIPVLIGVTFLIFVLFNLVAGDPTHLLLGKHATAAQMEELRRELGLDRPWFIQYLDVLKSAFTFDFGRSWASKQEIWQMIKYGAPVSLSFTLPALIIAMILSVSISLIVSFYRGMAIDRYSVFITVALMSIPSLAYILFGQYFFAYKLGMFEISGYVFEFPDQLAYTLLPILIMVVITVGPDTRFFRTVMLDEVYQDYVRTARAKGLSEYYILFKHVLKNAMIPIITRIATQLPFLILGSILLENFFGIPGLGDLTVQAVNQNDFPTIRAIAIIVSVFYTFFVLLSDIFYTLVDPRVRL